jgi:hypothetical protein
LKYRKPLNVIVPFYCGCPIAESVSNEGAVTEEARGTRIKLSNLLQSAQYQQSSYICSSQKRDNALSRFTSAGGKELASTSALRQRGQLHSLPTKAITDGEETASVAFLFE